MSHILYAFVRVRHNFDFMTSAFPTTVCAQRVSVSAKPIYFDILPALKKRIIIIIIIIIIIVIIIYKCFISRSANLKERKNI